MYLAFIWIEVLCPLWTIERDAFHHAAIVPSPSVIVAQYAENSVSLQCAMATHHQPPFSRAVTFLPCKDMKNEDPTEKTGYSPTMIMNTNKLLKLEHKQLNTLCVTQTLLIVIRKKDPLLTLQQIASRHNLCDFPPSPGCQNQAQGQRVGPRSGRRCFWACSS